MFEFANGFSNTRPPRSMAVVVPSDPTTRATQLERLARVAQYIFIVMASVYSDKIDLTMPRGKVEREAVSITLNDTVG